MIDSMVLTEIVHERDRQDAKWGVRGHSPKTWLPIIGEEFGELCQAINKTQIIQYREELIHVAASAIAAAEAFDRAVEKLEN